MLHGFLRMVVGPRAGSIYELKPDEENRIGRGLDCAVVLTDALCSRTHAVIARRDGAWEIRDAESRNGTFVNDQKIDEAVLGDGHRVRVGSTEFTFHLAQQAPSGLSTSEVGVTQTVVRNLPVTGNPAELPQVNQGDPRRFQQLEQLYELSFRLLGCEDPDRVLRESLELLRDWTHATLVGFLWLNDDGHLKPKILLPESNGERVRLSRSLTEMVCQQRQAVWFANQSAADSTESLRRFADALCVPLLHGGTTLGAVHVYLEEGQFQQSDFDFAIALSKIAAVALARARRESSLHSDFDHLAAKSLAFGDLVGESPPMIELKTKIGRLARATGCVLIRGESGAGKELVARALHKASPRADRPMLSVNCAAIPAHLMESQLFGHKAGAFTGADRDHAGYFQQADLGTLFLDEVGELTLDGQAKLLRILDGHPFLPVGASKEVSVDVRVIAATNQDLQTYVRERRFREDLYYRLSVFELCVPPLRERGPDVGLLVDYFLDHFKRLHGRPTLKLSAAARERLIGYHWPGNVRQLRNVMDSAVVLADDEILVRDLALRDAGSGELESLKLDFWEKRLIGEALRRTNGSVPDAATLLGIGRATLYRKIEQYGIQRAS